MSDTGLITLMFLSTLAGSAAGAWWNEKEVFKIKNQCEAELPRDQHCKLIAVPDKGE